MGIFLKKFETASEYEAYMASEDKVLPNVSFCEDERGVYYNPVHDYSKDYFTMVVTTGGGNVTWTSTTPNGSTTSNVLSYSKNNGKTWSESSSNITLQVNEGDKILWKGITTPTTDGIGKFSGDDNVRYTVEGNVMSLLFGDDFRGQTSLNGKNYALMRLFSNNNGNKNITNAENLSLPATTLSFSCYQYMFYKCTNLIIAPSKLPATTLVSACYNGMFRDCTSLTTAPELPALIIQQQSYKEMFRGCTSLTTAPELPGIVLTNYCYSEMFKGCTNLNSITCLATNILGNNCTMDWLSGVAASGTFIKAASMTSWTTGINGIPSGWTVQDA